MPVGASRPDGWRADRSWGPARPDGWHESGRVPESDTESERVPEADTESAGARHRERRESAGARHRLKQNLHRKSPLSPPIHAQISADLSTVQRSSRGRVSMSKYTLTDLLLVSAGAILMSLKYLISIYI